MSLSAQAESENGRLVQAPRIPYVKQSASAKARKPFGISFAGAPDIAQGMSQISAA